MGKLAIIVQRGLPIFMQRLATETLPMIRNYICAILREFSTLYPEELVKENFVEVCSGI